MKATITLFLIIFPLFISAQVKISKVSFELKDKNIEISYDIIGNSLSDSIYVEVLGKKSVKNITEGSNKKIKWDIISDNLKINEELKVSVLVKVITQSLDSQRNLTKKSDDNITPKKEGLKNKPSIKLAKSSGNANKKSLIILSSGLIIGAGLSISGYQMKSLADQYYSDYKNNNWNQKIRIENDDFLQTYSQASIIRANEDLAKAQKQLKISNILIYSGIGVVLIDAIYTIPRMRKSNKKLSYQLDFPQNNSVTLGINIKF
jgi:hypothetical protein